MEASEAALDAVPQREVWLSGGEGGLRRNQMMVEHMPDQLCIEIIPAVRWGR